MHHAYRSRGLTVSTPGSRGVPRIASPAVWTLATRSGAFLAAREVAGHLAQTPSLPADVPVWTDDFSSVFELIKFGSDDDESEPKLEEDEDPEEWEDR